MRSSLLAFATDLLDEGLETVADNVQHRAGAGGITLAAAYHDARDVFPHNPRRVVYFQEPGAVFFQPTPAGSARSKLQPARQQAARRARSRRRPRERRGAARDGCERVGRAAARRPRAARSRSSRQRNAFGDPYLTQLCPSNPTRGRTRRALIADVASRGVDSILMESFHFVPFPHGYHHERAFVEIGPLTSFCSRCASASRARGGGRSAGSMSRRCSDAVRPRFAAGCRRARTTGTRRSMTPVSVRALFGGELGGFAGRAHRRSSRRSLPSSSRRRARRTPDTVLVPVDEAVRSRAIASGRPTGAPAPSISWRLGVDLARGRGGRRRRRGHGLRLDRRTGAASTSRRTARRSPGRRSSASSCARSARIATSPANLRAKVEVASALGVRPRRLLPLRPRAARCARLDQSPRSAADAAATNLEGAMTMTRRAARDVGSRRSRRPRDRPRAAGSTSNSTSASSSDGSSRSSRISARGSGAPSATTRLTSERSSSTPPGRSSRPG